MARVHYVGEGGKGVSTVFVFEEESAGWIPSLSDTQMLAGKLHSRVLLSLYCVQCAATHAHPAVAFVGEHEKPAEPAVTVREGGSNDAQANANHWVEVLCPRGHTLASAIIEH